MGTNNFKLVANNKKAFHDYFIDDKYETGIELYGTEVKSIRMGKCSIKEAFVRIENGQVYVYGMHISPYEKGNIFNKDPLKASDAQKGDRPSCIKDQGEGLYPCAPPGLPEGKSCEGRDRTCQG